MADIPDNRGVQGLDTRMYPRVYRPAGYSRFWVPLLWLSVAAVDFIPPIRWSDLYSMQDPLLPLFFAIFSTFMLWRPAVTISRHSIKQRWLFHTRIMPVAQVDSIRTIPTTSFIENASTAAVIFYPKSLRAKSMTMKLSRFNGDQFIEDWLQQFPKRQFSP